MNEAQIDSLLVQCREFAAPAVLAGESEFVVSPHYKFDESLVSIRCIHDTSNGKEVVAYLVFDKATGLRRTDKEPTDEPLVQWVYEAEVYFQLQRFGPGVNVL